MIRNSAIADKPRDAFVLICNGVTYPLKTPLPHMYYLANVAVLC